MTRVRELHGIEVEYAATFGSALRDLRRMEGLSQEHFGQRVGIDHTTLSRYEAGRIMPSRMVVERIIERVPLARWEANRFRLAAGYAPRNETLATAAD